VATVAVLGLGTMGSRIARRLLEAGNEVVVWNRTAERAEPLVELGAAVAATPAEATSAAEIVLIMVTDADALAAVTEGEDGVAASTEPATVVQMSTVGPKAVRRLADALPAGFDLLDAPVLGSVAEVESGSLQILVGGDEDVLERCRPVLEALGRIVFVGPVGAGSAGKLVANAALLGTMAVVGEALSLGLQLGLSFEAAFDVLGATPLGAQAERRRPSLESGSYPPRFTLALARKDADLIEAAAEAAGADLRVGRAVDSWLDEAAAAGLSDLDYSAVLTSIVKGAIPQADREAPTS
jgi:3-hydroxyisobutyrate dehydrogenase-like beta-hydroxyacid dehydrogenase